YYRDIFYYFFRYACCIRAFHVTGVQTCALPIFDVYDRNAIDYHMGLSCLAEDVVRTVKRALFKRQLFDDKNCRLYVQTMDRSLFPIHLKNFVENGKSFMKEFHLKHRI